MKRVFLSFRAEDRKRVDGVRLLAANDQFDIEFYDESLRSAIDSVDADYIKRVIREKIRRASVTVCLMSAETHTSAWVDWEINESFEARNTVICMGLPGHPGLMTVPASALAHGLPWHGWDHNRLKSLIENA